MAFLFRFARVKSIRELEEDLAQQRLALARLEEQRQEEKLQRCRIEEQEAIAGFCRPQETKVLALELSARFCHEKAQLSSDQVIVREKAAAQVASEREELVLRMQKARIMQNLHDRHQEVYIQEDLLNQQKVLDEVGGVQHQRQISIRTTGR